MSIFRRKHRHQWYIVASPWVTNDPVPPNVTGIYPTLFRCTDCLAEERREELWMVS